MRVGVQDFRNSLSMTKGKTECHYEGTSDHRQFFGHRGRGQVLQWGLPLGRASLVRCEASDLLRLMFVLHSQALGPLRPLLCYVLFLVSIKEFRQFVLYGE